VAATTAAATAAAVGALSSRSVMLRSDRAVPAILSAVTAHAFSMNSGVRTGSFCAPMRVASQTTKAVVPSWL
jgi:hypothetical protein